MDERRARELLRVERHRVERALAHVEAAQRMDGVDEQVGGRPAAFRSPSR